MRGALRKGVLPAAITFAALAAAPASAATLVADYQFQDSRASSVGTAPPVTDLTANTFTTAPVGSCSAARVLGFPLHGGLKLDASALSGSTPYTLDMVVALDDVSGYRKLIDFQRTEHGLYVHDGHIDWREDSDSEYPATPTLVAGSFARVTVTVTRQTGDPDNIDVYVNGAFADSSTIELANDADLSGDVRLFQDETGGSAEDSGGRISGLRLYNGAMSSGEVAALGAAQPPYCAPPPPPPPPDTAITAKPKTKTSSKSATFEFTSDVAGVTFECSIDGAGYSACISPRIVSVSKGPHVFLVRARDGSGQVDPSPASYSWTVKKKHRHHRHHHHHHHH
jgi:hypothetical protein